VIIDLRTQGGLCGLHWTLLASQIPSATSRDFF